MTELLQHALDELKKRPSADQDAIASMILDELADDRRWDEKFAETQDKLGELARRARESVRVGRVRDGGWDDV